MAIPRCSTRPLHIGTRQRGNCVSPQMAGLGLIGITSKRAEFLWPGFGKRTRNSGRCAQQWSSPRKLDCVMSEPFRPYEKLVEISILGKKFHVPERNSLLRCFQFLSPETIPYGRFCWNQDCQYCRVSCQLPDDDESREMLACKFIVMPGMEVNELSQELKWCLRAKLPQDETVIQP